MKKSLQLTLFLILLLGMSASQAHDPGSSKAWITITADTVRVMQSFNPMELAALVDMDADSSGEIDASEFTLAGKKLDFLARTSVQMASNNITLSSDDLQISMDQPDAIVFDARYRISNQETHTVVFNLIPKLARGHRMFVTIQDASGAVYGQHILSSDASVIALDNIPQSLLDVVTTFIYEGVWHIWIGADHILFLLTLLLPTVLIRYKKSWVANDDLKSAAIDVLRIVTAFTVAHSITLSLAIFELIVLPVTIVETTIAISVFFSAVNNLWPMFRQARWLMAFVFGLIHGFGFASVLSDLNLPDENLLSALLSFNLGVEAGQLAIVAVVFPIMALLRYRPFYSRWILQGGSTAVALIAVAWGVQRSGVMSG